MRSSSSGDMRESRLKGRQWGPPESLTPLAVRSAILKTEAGGGYATCLGSQLLNWRAKIWVQKGSSDLWWLTLPTHTRWPPIAQAYSHVLLTCYCAGILSGVIMIPRILCNVWPNLKHFYMTVLVLWLTQMSGHPYRKIVWETQQAAEMCLRQPVWDWLRVLRQASWVRSGFNETRCVGISSICWGHGGPEEDAISGYAGELALVL